MITEVKLPQFGMGMQDATVIAWYRKVGERIEMDESLLEVEAAKTTVEVPSPVSGVLTRILVQVGENVPVLAILAEIDEGGAASAAADDAAAKASERADLPVTEVKSAATSSAAMAATQPRATPLAAKLAQEHGIALTDVDASGYGGRVSAADVRGVMAAPVDKGKVSVQVEPRARKLAKDSGMSLDDVSGTGPGGRIVEKDVQQALASRAAGEVVRAAATDSRMPMALSSPDAAPGRRAPAPVSATSVTESRPITTQASATPRRGMRDIIATRMMQSLQGSAQLTLTSEVDVTALVRFRDYVKNEFDVSFTCLFVKACATALKRHPQMNASWGEDGLRRHEEINVGVAVALDEGLLVPVIRDANGKSLRQVAVDFAQVVQRARSGAASTSELSGGTFSVSNLGNFGIDAFTPVLNPPEAGILGLGRIVDRMVRAGDGMAWRKMMVLSLTFDHRVLDGAPAAQFLQTVATIVAQPEGLLA